MSLHLSQSQTSLSGLALLFVDRFHSKVYCALTKSVEIALDLLLVQVIDSGCDKLSLIATYLCNR